MHNHLVLTTLLSVLFAMTAAGQPLSVMTYNIRYDNPKDGDNNWHHRKSTVVDLIEFYQPQIFGIQEGLHHQVAYIDSSLTNYTYIGVGRDDGKTKGEYCAIFYDSTQYSVSGASTFWLSETPEKISVGWDAALERVCTYGLFLHKQTRRQCWVFNTHFDHRGVEARKQSAALIVKKIKSLTKQELPIVLMGDFNSRPDSDAIGTITSALDDGLVLSKHGLYGPVGTYNSFRPDPALDGRIDYIFTSGLKVEHYVHIDDRRKNSLWVSDHLPVLARVR